MFRSKIFLWVFFSGKNDSSIDSVFVRRIFFLLAALSLNEILSERKTTTNGSFFSLKNWNRFELFVRPIVLAPTALLVNESDLPASFFDLNLNETFLNKTSPSQNGSFVLFSKSICFLTRFCLQRAKKKSTAITVGFNSSKLRPKFN